MPTVAFERWVLVGVFAAAFALGAGALPSPGLDDRVRALGAILADPEQRKPEELARVVSELGRIGPAAGAAAPMVIEYLADKKNRGEATMALLGMGPRAALPPLITALEHDDGQVASSAAAVIAAFGPAAARARPALLTALERPEVRQWAEHALNAIEGIEDETSRSAGGRPWME